MCKYNKLSMILESFYEFQSLCWLGWFYLDLECSKIACSLKNVENLQRSGVWLQTMDSKIE